VILNEVITIQLVEKYLAITSKAREKATPLTTNDEDERKMGVMLKMCDDYIADASYFANEGDLVRAFGAINYAHAWIDAAVRIGLMDGHGDDVIFTLP